MKGETAEKIELIFRFPYRHAATGPADCAVAPESSREPISALPHAWMLLSHCSCRVLCGVGRGMEIHPMLNRDIFS